MGGLTRWNPNVHNRQALRPEEWAERFVHFNTLELAMIQAQYEIKCVWTTGAASGRTRMTVMVMVEENSDRNIRRVTSNALRDTYMPGTANGHPGWYIYRIVLSGGKIIRPGDPMPMTMPAGEDTLYAQ